jgi:DNA-directed RNA polymerase specialized sigma24 family protein
VAERRVAARIAHGASATEVLPEASTLVQLARARLTNELDRLPPWGAPSLPALLRITARPQPASLGALTHFLRSAVRQGDTRTARDLFTTLLMRIEALNALWATRTVRRTPGLGGSAGETVREELLQELALALWQQIGCGSSEAWELFFFRALGYAQQHTATASMEQRGYRRRDGQQRSTQALAVLLSQLGASGDDGEVLSGADLADPSDAFSLVDLTDLRAMVLALPIRERMAVVMRFWQRAPEAEIADGLGVSTRMVRSYLRRAYDTLRRAYGGIEG